MVQVPEELQAGDLAADGEFVVLPTAAPVGPSDGWNLVRVQLPRSAMITAGLRVSADRAAELVQADVMLGADGQARAIRFLEN